MKVVFFGTPEVAVPSLDALLDSGIAVPLVVTQPDRPAGRSRAPRPPAVKRSALAHGLRVTQPRRIRPPAFAASIAEHRPDLLVVVAYGRILPAGVLEAARLGAVNVHFSLLPAYRGAAPVQWALARGETHTGVTTMRINERLDEGDLLLQREVRIEPGEHAPELSRRLSVLGAALLVETVHALVEGALVPRQQDDSRASLAPLLKRADGAVDPALDAGQIEGRVRGFDPWPGVWVRARGRALRLLEAEAVDGEAAEAPPGTVLAARPDGVAVACGGGSVLLLRRVQAEGRRPVAAREAVHGRLLVPGDRLEPGTV